MSIRWFGAVSVGFAFLAAAAAGAARETDRVSVPMSVTASGHLMVRAKIDGRTAFLLVDTAAGASVLHEGRLRELGLERERQRVGTAAGLGTASKDIWRVPVRRMDLGPARYERPRFFALDLRHVQDAAGGRGFHGLLGSDFLAAHGAVVDYRTRRLVLDAP